MLGPRCHEVGFTSDQEIVETRKAPHQSSVCAEDQPNTQISLPPLELHDPFAHALEESYIASTLAQCNWSTFPMFACMAQSRECVHLTSARSVAQHHGKSTDCMPRFSFTYVLWTHLNPECVWLHCYFFHVC